MYNITGCRKHFWQAGEAPDGTVIKERIRRKIVEDGRLTFLGSNLILGTMFAMSAIVFWVRNHGKPHDNDSGNTY